MIPRALVSPHQPTLLVIQTITDCKLVFLTIMRMTISNSVQLLHMFVGDTYEFVYHGDALQFIVKEKTIHFFFFFNSGETAVKYYPEQ